MSPRRPKVETLKREVPEGVGRAARRRMARSVLWLHVAMKCEQWAEWIEGPDPRDDDGLLLKPFSEWPDDDPLKRLCIVLDITPGELATILHDMGDLAETKADRLGYDEVPEAALG